MTIHLWLIGGKYYAVIDKANYNLSCLFEWRKFLKNENLKNKDLVLIRFDDKKSIKDLGQILCSDNCTVVTELDLACSSAIASV